MKQSLLYPVRNDTREFTLLDGMWKMQLDPEAHGEENGWQNGLPDSFSMPVPASFADIFTEKEKREYCGDFWYETKFFLDEDRSTRVILRFSGVTHRADVYINGKDWTFNEWANSFLRQMRLCGKAVK